MERVIKSGAKFNPDKAKWFNMEYLRMRDNATLAKEFGTILGSKGISRPDAYIEHVVGLIKERAHFVKDFWDLSDYLFVAPTAYDQAVKTKFWKEDTPQILKEVCQMLEGLETFSKESIEHSLSPYIKERGWQMGSVMNTLRLALVGESKGPGVADIMDLIGKDETLKRIIKLAD